MTTVRRCSSTAWLGFVVVWGVVLGVARNGHAQTSTEAEAEVKAAVERFLDAAGRYDVDAQLIETAGFARTISIISH